MKWRDALAITLAVVLVTTASAVPGRPANADEPRPARSQRPGLVAPEVATDLMRTDIVVSAGPGEAFAPFRLVGVQLVPMTKILRNGAVDQDHARAEWFFTLRFPRSSASWPPGLPEPTHPWRYHLFEMPGGAITGVGVEPGSPLYPPPEGLPANWYARLVDIARTQIPASRFDAAVNVDPADVDNTGDGGDAAPGDGGSDCPGAFGLDDEAPCGEADIVEEALAESDEPPPAPPVLPGVPAPPAPSTPPAPIARVPSGSAFTITMNQIARICTATFTRTEFCLASVAVAGPILAKVLEKRKPSNSMSLVPCFGQTAEVLGWMAVVESLLLVAAFKNSPEEVAMFGILALAAFGWGTYQYYQQVKICFVLVRLSVSSWLWHPAIASAAAAALAASTAAIIGVVFTLFRSIADIRTWWDEPAGA